MALAKQLSEFPEVIAIYEKLTRGESLNNKDLQIIDELSKETDWSIEDIMDEIKDLDNRYSRSTSLHNFR